jgi:crossover junction endodeoxyribonuclease RusA
VKLYPPDRRTRDLDNAGKAIFDSLKHAGVYVDDEQIDDLRFLRREVRKPGIVMVTLETIN